MKRKTRKKMFNIGCLPILIIFGLLMVIGNLSNNETKQIEYKDPLNIGRENVKALVDKKVPYNKWDAWGSPETLKGTDDKYWVCYLPKANISFVSEKKTDLIIFADFNKGSATWYINHMKEKRKEFLKKQFNPFNGSHKKLTKLIKQSMHDPDSFEHVKTLYWDNDDYLIVQTEYRGNNGFGAKRKGFIKARVDMDGNVIEILQTN